ncbi:hypothetical protein A7982_13598 [Minicystis rosea]|nr:hypothetical protein A7982_13598 [Minicystis rosea]
MIDGRRAFFIASMIMAYGAEARANECGDSFTIVAEDVEISPNPIAGCIQVTVDGTSRPGCEDLRVELHNECAFPITVVLDPSVDCTEQGHLGNYLCLPVEPGKGGNIYFPVSRLGPMTFQYPILAEDQAFTLTVKANLVDIGGASGCTIGAGGTGHGAPTWVGLAGLGLALFVVRRRKTAV